MDTTRAIIPGTMNIRQATFVVFLTLACLAAGPPTGAQESGGPSGSSPGGANPLKLEGRWLRPDGGYILELAAVGFDGSLRASYFNPRPINVSEAAWRLEEGLVVAFVVLRDVNYPGSTYTLAYFPERDALAGYYYQAAQGETFEVIFERQKEDR